MIIFGCKGDDFMANLTGTINVNVDVNIKKQANAILNDLGLNMSTAINMFLAQIIKQDGIPFEVKNPRPTRELIKALKEADDIVSGKVDSKRYYDVDELFEDLDK